MLISTKDKRPFNVKDQSAANESYRLAKYLCWAIKSLYGIFEKTSHALLWNMKTSDYVIMTRSMLKFQITPSPNRS